MKAHQAEENNTLAWVRGELDGVLSQARRDLEAYIEEDQDPSLLNKIQESLLVISGTLEMLELFSAATLTQEINELVLALIDGRAEHESHTYEVLMRAIIYLADYLEQLQAGFRDVPILLLPLLNDLRAAHNATPLTDRALFAPDLERTVPLSTQRTTPTEGQDVRLLAKRARHVFECGLLGWFRGKDVRDNLNKLQSVTTLLYKASKNDASQRLWWISSALVEALTIGGLASSSAVKSLLGKIDRQIKRLVDQGDELFAASIPNDLNYDILYYLAIAEARGERVLSVKNAFSLRNLLPDESELEVLRRRAAAPSAKLMHAVTQAIHEDLAEVKDSLEIIVSNDVEDPQRLDNLVQKLRQISDTLGMLGMHQLRELVLEEAEVISGIVKGNINARDNALMKMAGVMLNVESAIDNIASSFTNEDGEEFQNEFLQRTELDAADAETRLAPAEYNRLLGTISAEALSEMSKTKESILGYIATPKDTEQLANVPDYLINIIGALELAKVEHAPLLLESIKSYVTSEILGKHLIPSNDDLDILADAITSVECFLEALGAGKKDPFSILDTGYESMAKLGYPVTTETPKVATIQPIASDSDDTSGAARLTEVNEQFDVSVHEPEHGTEAPSVVSHDITELPENGDIDEDILEVFLEEAGEELSNIKQQISALQNDVENTEAITTLRRSFHTLKGSGRIIGANVIGDFAWTFENMLNRVIDGSIPIRDETLASLIAAVDILPKFIDQLNGQDISGLDYSGLIEKVDAISRGKLISEASENPQRTLNSEMLIDQTNINSDAQQAGVDEQDENRMQATKVNAQHQTNQLEINSNNVDNQELNNDGEKQNEQAIREVNNSSLTP